MHPSLTACTVSMFGALRMTSVSCNGTGNEGRLLQVVLGRFPCNCMSYRSRMILESWSDPRAFTQ